MNTEQNYVGRDNYANTPPPMAQNAAKTPSTPDGRQIPTEVSQSTIQRATVDAEINISVVGNEEQDSDATRIYWALETYKRGSLESMLSAFGRGDDITASYHMDEVEDTQNLQNHIFERIANLADANFRAATKVMDYPSREELGKLFTEKYRKSKGEVSNG